MQKSGEAEVLVTEEFNSASLRYQAGILGHSMTEMKAFFTSGFNTLKIRSIVLRLHFEYL
ncbi:hypothetical protein IMM1_03730 [Pseudocoprococcus immobilis]